MKQYLLFLIPILIGCSSNGEKSATADTSKHSLLAQQLFVNLKEMANDKLLFGHQDDVAYGIGWKGGEFNSDVQKVSGDYPALFGWDIGYIDSVANLDGVLFTDMKSWIKKAYDKGGVITIGWHEKNLVTGESSWDTTKLVDKILPGGVLNEAYKIKLDKVAAFMNDLETEEGEKIPVIFRPFHEHNGHWFWWGYPAASHEEYKQLWRFTVDYLRDTLAVNQLLYCYSTDVFQTREEYLQRYPGDDYVDILGYDDYKSITGVDKRNWFHTQLSIINQLAIEKDKVAALSETGRETIPNPNWWTEVLLEGVKTAPETNRIAYVLVWRNAHEGHHYAPYPGHPSCTSFKQFYNDSTTVFLNDLPNMYE